MYKFGWTIHIKNAALQFQISTEINGGERHQLRLAKMWYDPKASRHGAKTLGGYITRMLFHQIQNCGWFKVWVGIISHLVPIVCSDVKSVPDRYVVRSMLVVS